MYNKMLFTLKIFFLSFDSLSMICIGVDLIYFILLGFC